MLWLFRRPNQEQKRKTVINRVAGSDLNIRSTLTHSSAELDEVSSHERDSHARSKQLYLFFYSFYENGLMKCITHLPRKQKRNYSPII